MDTFTFEKKNPCKFGNQIRPFPKNLALLKYVSILLNIK